MTNKTKATSVLAIIIQELNLPAGCTIGDVAWALHSIDPDGEILGILKPLISAAVLDGIKERIAAQDAYLNAIGSAL